MGTVPRYAVLLACGRDCGMPAGRSCKVCSGRICSIAGMLHAPAPDQGWNSRPHLHWMAVQQLEHPLPSTQRLHMGQ